MKHGRPDFEHIQDPTGQIAADMPVFLLLGKDKAAPAAVRAWAEAAKGEGADENTVNGALAQAELMSHWQKENGSQVPTVPAGVATFQESMGKQNMQANVLASFTVKQRGVRDYEIHLLEQGFTITDGDTHGGPSGVSLRDLVQAMRVSYEAGCLKGQDLPTIRQMRKTAVSEQRPGTVIVDSSKGPHSIDTEITLPDGTPIGHMIQSAQLNIGANQPHKLTLELCGASVIAQVMDYQIVLDIDEALEKLEYGTLEPHEVREAFNMVRGNIRLAKGLMGQAQMLHGRTLYQWCKQFGITDATVIERAAAMNEERQLGLRVFPDGKAWMAIDDDYVKDCGPEARVAFGDTPDEAYQAWLIAYCRADDNGVG